MRMIAVLSIVLGVGCAHNTVADATMLAAAPDSATEHAILSARDAIWRAWFANDTAQMRLLLPDAVAAGQDQRWADRASTLDEAKQFVASGGTLRTLAFPRTEIHLMGDVAVVFSNFDVGTTVNGTEHDMRGRSTEIFVLRNGRWVNPFWHLNPS